MRVEHGARHTRAMGRGLALVAFVPVQLAMFAVQAVALALTCVGLVVTFPPVTYASRGLPRLARRRVERWSGVVIPQPYRTRPELPKPGPDGMYRSRDGRNNYKTPTVPQYEDFARWIWTDPASWRDMAWLLLDPLVGGLLAILPWALVGYGLTGLIAPLPWHWITGPGPTGLIVAVPSMVLGWVIAPTLLRLHAAWTKVLLAPARASAVARGQARRHRAITGLRGATRCIALAALSLCTLPIFAGALLALLFGGPVLVVRLLTWARWVPNQFRQLTEDWSGIVVPRPYQPEPVAGGEVSGTAWWSGFASRSRTAFADPANWRDLLWFGCQWIVGLVLALPMAMFGYGLWGLAFPSLTHLFGAHVGAWYGQLFGSAVAAGIGGLLMATLGLAVASALLWLHSRWVPVLLGPTANARLLMEREELTARVERLTETRTDATDTQAAEVRRIERDLHDGAQARLVAMGMALGAIEALIDHDPERAKKLVVQVRETSAAALIELRGLVRGIHPPVLAERGLVDAIRALALDSPLRVQVNAQLVGHAEAPVESAVYFAIAELLTNAARHSGAERVWIDAWHRDNTLRVTVLDDGAGGANRDRGTGLRGIERRLGTFDGRVTVSSPQGGPTMVTMELPCALSSPRTSTSSETE